MVITEALQQPQELDFKGDFLHDEEGKLVVKSFKPLVPRWVTLTSVRAALS